LHAHGCRCRCCCWIVALQLQREQQPPPHQPLMLLQGLPVLLGLQQQSWQLVRRLLRQQMKQQGCS
jgi:hypothetical protein